MRRLLSLLLVGVFVLGVAGCNNNVSKMDVDAPVTAAEVNSASDFVVRGFLESIFNNDRELFEKCFPEQFITDSKNAGIDLFDQYVKTLEDDGTFVGTQYLNYNELSAEGGYSDADFYRHNIAFLVGAESDNEITAMHIDHIKVYFTVDGTNRYREVYGIAYEYKGAWYMYELQNSDAEFGKK